ncbi:MAG: hypothetical protein NT118_03295 [Lentisphaerae bacterium]|nr:hypothetical protein [Lentisphaerota bacterium]
MKASINVCLVMVLCLLMVAGCSRPESGLVGKWVGKSGSFDFMKDKTGLINPPEGVALPRNVQFKWSIQGSDTVRIDVGPPVGKTFFGKLESKDALIIEDDKFVKQK